MIPVLVVDALDGAPGIYSARWAGPSSNGQEVATARFSVLLFCDMFFDELRGQLFIPAADLADHDDGLGVRVFLEHL